MAGSIRYTSLNAVAVTGAGKSNENFSPRYIHSMQVILGGDVVATGAKVAMEATFDGGVTWGQIGLWDLASNVSGDIVTVEGISANRVRANLLTLTGGTNPTVTAIINSEPN